MKCPGQDSRYWNEHSIFEQECPQCGTIIEFFKDDSFRKCKECKAKVKNPKMDLGCAEYCEFSAECLGFLNEEDDT